MADEKLIAHLLRRVTFGPLPGEVERLAGAGGVQAALDEVLTASPVPPDRPPKLDRSGDGAPLAKWWLARLGRPGVGMHEKLTWWWHGHFTTSDNKVDRPPLLWRQHLLLREHATGDFADLVAKVTVDPAMLIYLDGDGSSGDAPNENYGRELLELFSLGRGNYSQADVAGAARALAGWTVGDDGRAGFDEAGAYPDTITFLGTTGRLRASDVAAIVCAQPACARFIVSKLHRYFVGTVPDPARTADLAAIFRGAGLDIRPVMEDILRHPSFFELRLNRAREPVEWVTAALAALGLADPQLAYDTCAAMGQMPFSPPNVAGWPGGSRWLGASMALVRAGLAVSDQAVVGVASQNDPVGAVLHRCSLYEVSESTRAALVSAAAAVPDTVKQAKVLLALAIASPEFALA